MISNRFNVVRRSLGMAVVATLFVGGGVIAPMSAGATTTKTVAVKQFRADALALMLSTVPFTKAEASMTSTTPGTTVLAAAKPFITGLQKFQRQLHDQSWPSRAGADARTFSSAFSPFIRDLKDVANIDISNSTAVSAWNVKAKTAELNWESKLQQIERDLGMPVTPLTSF
jgi:hypothetical protein